MSVFQLLVGGVSLAFYAFAHVNVKVSEEKSKKSRCKVLVASGNRLKINAVRSAFVALNNEPDVVSGVDAKSGVNEQPYGLEETIRGATNRMQNALQSALVPAVFTSPFAFPVDFIVAIENGVVDVPLTSKADKVWFDIAVIVLYHVPSQQTFYSTSEGIVFPAEVCKAQQLKGFEENTVGEKLSEYVHGLNPKDPHSFFTNNLANRESILTRAVMLAIAQFRGGAMYDALPVKSSIKEHPASFNNSTIHPNKYDGAKVHPACLR